MFSIRYLERTEYILSPNVLSPPPDISDVSPYLSIPPQLPPPLPTPPNNEQCNKDCLASGSGFTSGVCSAAFYKCICDPCKRTSDLLNNLDQYYESCKPTVFSG